MEWIATLQRAIEYMEEHLMEEINYEDVAESVLVDEETAEFDLVEMEKACFVSFG